MKDFWNQRYSEPEYAYGTEPNAFFKSILDTLPPGRLLLPAEGQGRNGVYAATRGWQVDAFDYSEVAREKALALARERGVSIHYDLAEVESFSVPPRTYDAIGLIYVHLPPEVRTAFHRRLVEGLQPGGKIILECFSKEQLRFNSGGPRDPRLLYRLDDLREDFQELQEELAVQEIVELSEGPYHRGKASVVRFVGCKSA
ncbi:MAG: class I SAM-dependent methyltransferase [Calditrichaeota bacterium]|nr:MAG: class I SAM-dependent methyltransferase [Calditrichota bacterium]